MESTVGGLWTTQDWTVSQHIWFFNESTALCYSEIGWVIGREPQIWREDYGTWACMDFGFPGGCWVSSSVLLRNNCTSFSRFLLPIYSFPVLSVCENLHYCEWMTEYKEEGIQFCVLQPFWEYTIYIVVEMSTRERFSMLVLHYNHMRRFNKYQLLNPA